ncbi:hypothetical protein MMC25_002659 [Agyrium rufum]|nr:hypothetical protein [Agyrium rufum]
MGDGSKRRKAGKGASVRENSNIKSADDIPLAQPPRDTTSSKPKTLYEIAAERQAQLQQYGQPFASTSANGIISNQFPTKTVKISPDGILTELSESEDVASRDNLDDEELIGPVGEALLYIVTLTMLHFTLDVVAHQQYREEIDWRMITRRTLTVSPVLFGLVYGLHSRKASLWVQGLFAIMGAVTGCYLVYIANEMGYYAIMKRAPPLGTLWVWSVVEMQLTWALGSLAAVIAFFWQGGYSI